MLSRATIVLALHVLQTN